MLVSVLVSMFSIVDVFSLPTGVVFSVFVVMMTSTMVVSTTDFELFSGGDPDAYNSKKLSHC